MVNQVTLGGHLIEVVRSGDTWAEFLIDTTDKDKDGTIKPNVLAVTTFKAGAAVVRTAPIGTYLIATGKITDDSFEKDGRIINKLKVMAFSVAHVETNTAASSPAPQAPLNGVTHDDPQSEDPFADQ